jgi:dipeptide transport system ATP-binding protein
MTTLAAEGLVRHFPVRGRGIVQAVNGVSFALEGAVTLAIVGESGCGKSTLGRLVSLLDRPDAGSIQLDGQRIAAPGTSKVQPKVRRAIQTVFQDPWTSLNPRMTLGAILDEPLRLAGGMASAARRKAVAEMAGHLGFASEQLNRYPHMFSGGQRQRIAIGRALMLHPAVLVLDEPVSALDVSIQAQIIALLLQLQRDHRLMMLFISHDLAVVRSLAHEVLVLYLGKVMEVGGAHEVLDEPLHPYTKALRQAAPRLRLSDEPPAPHAPLPGDPPSPLAPPEGCVFHPRCPHAIAICRNEIPQLRLLEGRQVACHRAHEWPAAAGA